MNGMVLASLVGMVVVVVGMAYLFLADVHNLPGGFRF